MAGIPEMESKANNSATNIYIYIYIWPSPSCLDWFFNFSCWTTSTRTSSRCLLTYRLPPWRRLTGSSPKMQCSVTLSSLSGECYVSYCNHVEGSRKWVSYGHVSNCWNHTCSTHLVASTGEGGQWGWGVILKTKHNTISLQRESLKIGHPTNSRLMWMNPFSVRRADEANHRVVNHTFADMHKDFKQDAVRVCCLSCL